MALYNKNNLSSLETAARSYQGTKDKIERMGLAGRTKTANADMSLGIEKPGSELVPKLVSRMKNFVELTDNAKQARSELVNRINKEQSGESPKSIETPVSSNTQETGERLMSDVAEALGLTDEQAAGIVGNFAHETGDFKFLQELKPVVPGSKGGRGFAMWTGPRRKAFEAWSAQNSLDPDSYEASFGFFIHEVQNTSEGRFMDKLQEATTAEEAARIFSKGYLRPGKPMMDSRISRANSYIGGQE